MVKRSKRSWREERKLETLPLTLTMAPGTSMEMSSGDLAVAERCEHSATGLVVFFIVFADD
jgi:hypothetical protein